MFYCTQQKHIHSSHTLLRCDKRVSLCSLLRLPLICNVVLCCRMRTRAHCRVWFLYVGLRRSQWTARPSILVGHPVAGYRAYALCTIRYLRQPLPNGQTRSLFPLLHRGHPIKDTIVECSVVCGLWLRETPLRSLPTLMIMLMMLRWSTNCTLAPLLTALDINQIPNRAGGNRVSHRWRMFASECSRPYAILNKLN